MRVLITRTRGRPPTGLINSVPSTAKRTAITPRQHFLWQKSESTGKKARGRAWDGASLQLLPQHADGTAHETRLQAGSLRLEGGGGDMHREERGKEANPEPLLLLTCRVLTVQILSTFCASLTSQACMLRHQNPLFTGDEDAAQWRSALRSPGVTGELPQRSKVASGSADSARGKQASVFSKRMIKFSQTGSSCSQVPGTGSSFRICFLRA